jgi:hypothetical protein
MTGLWVEMTEPNSVQKMVTAMVVQMVVDRVEKMAENWAAILVGTMESATA